MRSKRLRISVRVKRSGGWVVVSAGQDIMWCATKKQAIKLARGIGRAAWAKGRPAQLVCFKMNGTIEWEATYGLDPRRYKG